MTKTRDLLDEEMFTCMVCENQFDHTQGTWPENYSDGTPKIILEWCDEENTRSNFEFVCYDCLE